MRRQIRMKTIRNLNLDHLGGKCQILTIWGKIEEKVEVRQDFPQMVKIQHFFPKWSRLRL